MRNLNLIIIAACMLVSACSKKAELSAPPSTTPAAKPTITGIDPLSGKLNDSLRIFGTGFNTDTSQDVVTINGVKATITRVSSTELKVSVPARCFNGNVNVQVNGTLVKGPLFQYTFSTGIVSTLAGNGISGYVDGVGTAAQFSGPAVLALDSTGDLFVGDVDNYRIRKITLSNANVTSFAGTGNIYYMEGPALLGQFKYISGLVVDKTGVLYVSDNAYNNIRSISSDGTLITNIAGTPNSSQVYTDGTLTDSRFNGPNGLVIDNAGDLLVADQRNGVIRKIDITNNAVSTFVGRGPAIYLGVPVGMAYSVPNGNLYLADIYHSWIDRIFSNATYWGSFGDGTPGYVDGMSGPGLEFNAPTGVALDETNRNYNIYVADAGNNCIRMVDGYYNILTIAGNPAGGYADGVGTAAKFSNPTGIAIDNVNHILYVADDGNSCIRKILLE